MRSQPVALSALLIAVALSVPAHASAQSPATQPFADTTCSYARCALGIAPRWNGLALVRGTAGTQVANLNFFWPRSLGHTLAGSDSAVHFGAKAVRVRRVAALLTDAGSLLLGYALARRLGAESLTGDARTAAAIGAASVAVSVPLQFAADGHLSRAVWWHNLRFAR